MIENPGFEVASPLRLDRVGSLAQSLDTKVVS